MAKDLTAISAEVAKTLATEPLLSIAVTWGYGGPTVTYRDKDPNGKILSISGLDDVVKVDSKGSSGAISVVLDDTDGSIKAIMETQDAQKGRCVISQEFDGVVGSSVLFTGELSTPIVWNEGDRSVSFEVVAHIESKEIGFSAESGEFDFIADSAIGKAWPLCFGSPLKVPALKLTEDVRGSSLTRYSIITLSELESLCAAAQAIVDIEVTKAAADANPGYSDANYAIVIENLTTATISLNTTLGALLYTSPSREVELRAYIDACQSLREQERNQTLYTTQIAELDTQLASLEASRDTALAQLIVEQDKPAPDTNVVATLQAEIDLLENGSAVADGINSLTTTRLTTLALLMVANANVAIYTTTKTGLETTLTRIDLAEILVLGGEDFPQGEDLNIIVNGAKFRGSFNGQVFTVTDANLPTYSGVVLGARQNDNANEIWVEDPTLQLKGQYLYFNGQGVVYVESQQGTNCFISPILYSQTDALPALEGVGLDNGNPFIREIYDPLLLTGPISETGVIFRDHWRNALASLPSYASGLSNIRALDYSIDVGDQVYLDSDYKDLYIANLIPSSSVNAVFAYRTIDGESKLQPVPSRYYTVDLSEAIAGQTATTIRMLKPLGQYVDEQWSEDLYVSLTSTVGPNTADILDYLVTNYTNFTSEATSLTALQSALANYPSHFALLTREDALTAIQDIAWQARSAVYVVNEEAVYKYLATGESPVRTITESDIQLQTMQVAYSETEDLVTKLIGEWRFDHAQEEPHQVVIRNNVTKYGKLERTFNFYIYNIKELVTKSLVFWMFRMSNTYKILRFTSFLKTLELQTFDTVTLSFADTYVATAPVLGVVQRATYDSNDISIEYEVLVAVRSGEMAQYAFFWSADAADAYPGPEDIYAGGGV